MAVVVAPCLRASTRPASTRAASTRPASHSAQSQSASQPPVKVIPPLYTSSSTSSPSSPSWSSTLIWSSPSELPIWINCKRTAHPNNPDYLQKVFIPDSTLCLRPAHLDKNVISDRPFARGQTIWMIRIICQKVSYQTILFPKGRSIQMIWDICKKNGLLHHPLCIKIIWITCKQILKGTSPEVSNSSTGHFLLRYKS